MSSKYRVAVDIGGTFTDFVIQDVETGHSESHKVPSTAGDAASAVLGGVHDLVGSDLGIELLVHGTTVGLKRVVRAARRECCTRHD